MEFNRKNARDAMIQALENPEEIKKFEEIKELILDAVKNGSYGITLGQETFSLYCQAKLEELGFTITYCKLVGTYGTYQIQWVGDVKQKC